MGQRMRARVSVLLCVLLVAAVAATAQSRTAVVRGRVVNARGAGVSRVKVTVGPQWAFTDTGGRYVVSGVPEGRYRAVLEYQGRTTRTAEFAVRGPVTNAPDFTW
jgi:hypothetical protein